MVTVYFKAPTDTGSFFEEEVFYDANYAKFTNDDKFLVLSDLKAKNSIAPIREIGRFRTEYVIGYKVRNDDEDDE